MSTSTPTFVAQLLKSSASAYAGLAASLLLERQPEVAERYAPTAMREWKSHLQQRILELAAAMDMEEPRLFSSRIRWEKAAFRSRNLDAHDLRSGLICLRDLLAEELPDAGGEKAAEYIGAALDVLVEPPRERVGLDASFPRDRLALEYLQAALNGESRRAVDLLVTAIEGELSVEEGYGVLLAAQREVGHLWHQGDLEVSEEHLVTATTERATSVLAQIAPREPENGKTVVVSAVAGNRHGLVVRVLADFFEIGGWRSICLGPDVPVADIAKAVIFFDADLLALSVALPTQLKAAQHTVHAVRALEDRQTKIMVGGGALSHAPELWRRLGADGSVGDLAGASSFGLSLL